MNDILDRLDRLERRNDALAAQNRLLRGLLLLAAVGGVGVAFLGGRADAQGDKAAVVKAKAFVVVDAKGSDRATFGMDGDGVSMTLLDGRGKQAAVVQVDRGRPAVVLQADGGDSQATMALFSSGPRLQFKHEKTGTFVVGSTKDGTRMSMIHEAGKPGLELLATAGGAGIGWSQRKDQRGSIVLEDRSTLPSFLDGSGKPLLPRLLKK